MKKVMAFFVAMMMVVSLVACGGSSNSTEKSPANIENSQEAGEAEAEENTDKEGNTADSNTTEESSNEKKTNVLVAYFSATHTTEGVAKEISSALGADLYEIIPENPYTEADLDYNDDNSRTTIEMNDASSRPAISGSVENMDQYDTIFLGYPIWWGDAPRIISTFVESYDFSGKTIVPFCTSGGSGIGSSASNLEKLTSGANWLSGQRFSGSSAHEEIADWINGLDLKLTIE